ncbi:hypothetical protein NMY22_g14320 [Coprinellus aureogranulatus]|nr:hypothetical protein NMY22_g14320 [Coprinellus aureogranulatus]
MHPPARSRRIEKCSGGVQVDSPAGERLLVRHRIHAVHLGAVSRWVVAPGLLQDGDVPGVRGSQAGAVEPAVERLESTVGREEEVAFLFLEDHSVHNQSKVYEAPGLRGGCPDLDDLIEFDQFVTLSAEPIKHRAKREKYQKSVGGPDSNPVPPNPPGSKLLGITRAIATRLVMMRLPPLPSPPPLPHRPRRTTTIALEAAATSIIVLNEQLITRIPDKAASPVKFEEAFVKIRELVGHRRDEEMSKEAAEWLENVCSSSHLFNSQFWLWIVRDSVTDGFLWTFPERVSGSKRPLHFSPRFWIHLRSPFAPPLWKSEASIQGQSLTRWMEDWSSICLAHRWDTPSMSRSPPNVTMFEDTSPVLRASHTSAPAPSSVHLACAILRSMPPFSPSFPFGLPPSFYFFSTTILGCWNWRAPVCDTLGPAIRCALVIATSLPAELARISILNHGVFLSHILSLCPPPPPTNLNYNVPGGKACPSSTPSNTSRRLGERHWGGRFSWCVLPLVVLVLTVVPTRSVLIPFPHVRTPFLLYSYLVSTSRLPVEEMQFITSSFRFRFRYHYTLCQTVDTRERSGDDPRPRMGFIFADMLERLSGMLNPPYRRSRLLISVLLSEDSIRFAFDSTYFHGSRWFRLVCRIYSLHSHLILSLLRFTTMRWAAEVGVDDSGVSRLFECDPRWFELIATGRGMLEPARSCVLGIRTSSGLNSHEDPST